MSSVVKVGNRLSGSLKISWQTKSLRSMSTTAASSAHVGDFPIPIVELYKMDAFFITHIAE